jgi:hypothetical protein
MDGNKEKNDSPEFLPIDWQLAMREGIEEAFQNYEQFELINASPISVAPDYYDDDREWEELNDAERKFLNDELFRFFGFSPETLIEVDSYNFKAPEHETVKWKGKAKVTVYETKRSKLENMYVHKIERPKVEPEYTIAPKDFRI